MALPVWLQNLIAFSLQLAVLASVGTLLLYLFRLRVPRVALLYWQGLLLVCLLLPCLQPWEHPRILPGPPALLAAEVAGEAVAEIATGEASPPPKPIPWKYVPQILGGGILLRFLWLFIGFLRLGRFRRKSRAFGDGRPAIEDMQRRTGVRAAVLLSPAVHGPVTFGWRSPTVILPLSFRSLSEPCKRAVLCHELIHVRRGDWIAILAEESIRSLLWFHPAVWWLLGRIRLSREQVVDQEVVRLMGDKQPYLDSLLEFARTHRRLQAAPAPLFLSERHLVQRVALLLREVSMNRTRLAFSMIGISTLMLATLHFAAGSFPLTGAPALRQEPILAQAPEPASEPGRADSPAPDRPQVAELQAPPVVATAAVAAVAQTPGTEIEAPRGNPIRVGGNVQESRLIHRVIPEYPALARKTRVTGTVRLVVTINEEGWVWDIEVAEGHPLLVDSAVAAVRQWQYHPTLLNGVPVPVIAQVDVTYNLRNPEDLMVSMARSGDLNPEPDEIVQTPGTVYLAVEQGTPYDVAQEAVRALIDRGIRRLQLSGGPYFLFRGKLYLSGPVDRAVNPLSRDAIMDAFGSVLAAGEGNPIRINYRIFINEAGTVDGMEQLGGDAYPEFEDAVLRARVEPALLNGSPVPYARTLTRYSVASGAGPR
ncbi:MAG: TonB family protein [Acidobacteria bacterium]|nr:TonB family protein [Acidobacteriota bacterium]